MKKRKLRHRISDKYETKEFKAQNFGQVRNKGSQGTEFQTSMKQRKLRHRISDKYGTKEVKAQNFRQV
jgi:hypothetical protein